MLAIICSVGCIVEIIYNNWKTGMFLLIINIIIIAISIHSYRQMKQWKKPKENKQLKKSKNYFKTCSLCNKELVSGAFPKWFCLNKNCSEYLKSKIK